MNIHDLIANPPTLHIKDDKLVSAWKLADEELLFLDSQATQGMKTIETGAGISTIAFAIKGTVHTCIVPDAELVDRIKLYCDEHGISQTNINFIIDRSEHALPRLENKNFDLALIDGRHGFPTPFIDWFYMADLLKTGGILIIDDLHIWTCELLMQFLVSEEEWDLVKETLSAVIFVKRWNNAQHKSWNQQIFVLSQSRQVSLVAKARYLLNLLKRKNLSLFWSVVALGIKSAMEGRFGERGRR
ncbi:MAG: class I SAM-dependent methyltransferase [Nitrospiraceae bacterium]